MAETGSFVLPVLVSASGAGVSCDALGGLSAGALVPSVADNASASRFGKVSDAERARLQGLLRSSRADNTLRAYAVGWKAFARWCHEAERACVPAEPATVALFIDALVERRASAGTVGVYVAAVRHVHHRLDLPTPTAHPKVVEALEAARRVLGTRPKNRKAALTWDELPKLLAKADRRTAYGVRDAAMLLVCFAAALRRSELVALQRDDVRFDDRGALLTIRRSKTDQEAKGEIIAVARHPRDADLCPVTAMERWFAIMKRARWDQQPFVFVQMSGDTLEPVPDYTFAALVKKYATAAGLDARKFSGHSLRAGFVTQAVRNGISESVIQAQTRHRSAEMIAVYRREADPFTGTVGARIYGTGTA